MSVCRKCTTKFTQSNYDDPKHQYETRCGVCVAEDIAVEKKTKELFPPKAKDVVNV